MVAKSNLSKFLKANPWADLVVVPHLKVLPHHSNHQDIEGPSSIRYTVTQKDIATYSRRRDAYRALRKNGYVQEGIFWRHVPVAARPVEASV